LLPAPRCSARPNAEPKGVTLGVDENIAFNPPVQHFAELIGVHH
jgi:hypothetical protein